MPRYFFDVHEGVDRLDKEGTELPGLDAAYAAALRLIAHLLADEADRLKLGEDWYMVVADETGLILFRLDFHSTASSAVQRHLRVEKALS